VVVRWDADPEYKRQRARLLALRPPCARCGGQIDYDGPRWFVHSVTGQRVPNDRAFDAGHVVAKRDLAPGARPVLQAEHQRCNRQHGQSIARRKPMTKVDLAQSESW
jgi:hypothetical protein